HCNRNGGARMGQRMVTEIQCPASMGKPAHDQLVAAYQLLAIDAQVLALGVGASGDDQAPCEQGGDVIRPAALQRNVVQVNVVTFQHDFLAGSVLDGFWTHVPQGVLEHGNGGQSA